MTDTEKNKEEVKKETKVVKKGSLVLVLGILVLVSWLGTGYFFNRTRTLKADLSQLRADPGSVAREESKELVDKVGELVSLPEDEDPIIATVDDISELEGQAFFEKAEEGDKVLIYAKARKVYLYDPDSHKILEIAPLNIGSIDLVTVETDIVLANGTEIEGLTGVVEDKLAKAMPKATIVSKVNAAKSDYDKTIMVDLSGESSVLAVQIARALGVELVDLPEGEGVDVEANFLLIVGMDQSES